eukprot:5966693-Pyramimonas_sp.AAC.1
MRVLKAQSGGAWLPLCCDCVTPGGGAPAPASGRSAGRRGGSLVGANGHTRRITGSRRFVVLQV